MRQQKSSVVVFGGGLDLISPPQSTSPGSLIQCKNVESSLLGGYSVVKGFERFDGRLSPTDTQYTALFSTTDASAFTVNETITGGTSGATAIVLQRQLEGLYVIVMSGSFEEGETVTGGTSGASVEIIYGGIENGLLNDNDSNNLIRGLKADYLRSFIQEVPGQGPVLGAYRLQDEVLAIREDLAGTNATMYKSTPTGWSAVDNPAIIFYNNRTNSIITEDKPTINDGAGNTAKIIRNGINIIGGTEGYIVVSGFTSGFTAGDPIKVGDTVLATVAVDAYEYRLKAGGKSQWVSFNFTGAIDRYRAYHADGVNAAFEYRPDENTFAPIFTDQSSLDNDTPSFIAIYRNHLFLGYKYGAVRNSEPGNPFIWDAAAGTIEISVGAPVTGFDAVPEALVIFTKRTTSVLYGEIAENFQQSIAAETTGSYPYTVQHMGTTYSIDDRGVLELSRSDKFGNFSDGTVSKKINPIFKRFRENVVTSYSSYNDNKIVFVTGTGEALTMTFMDDQQIEFTTQEFGIGVYNAAFSEASDGNEFIAVCGTDGYVYRFNTGVSFDGEEIEYFGQSAYHFIESPSVRKRFYRAYISISVEGTAEVSYTCSFSLGSNQVRDTNDQIRESKGFKSAWDIGLWDSAIFDSRIQPDAFLDLNGTGDSVSLVFYGLSATSDLPTIKDIDYHFKYRRRERSAR